MQTKTHDIETHLGCEITLEGSQFVAYQDGIVLAKASSLTSVKKKINEKKAIPSLSLYELNWRDEVTKLIVLSVDEKSGNVTFDRVYANGTARRGRQKHFGILIPDTPKNRELVEKLWKLQDEASAAGSALRQCSSTRDLIKLFLDPKRKGSDEPGN